MEEPLAEKRTFCVAAREKMSVVWAARLVLAWAGAARGAAEGCEGLRRTIVHRMGGEVLLGLGRMSACMLYKSNRYKSRASPSLPVHMRLVVAKDEAWRGGKF